MDAFAAVAYTWVRGSILEHTATFTRQNEYVMCGISFLRFLRGEHSSSSQSISRFRRGSQRRRAVEAAMPAAISHDKQLLVRVFVGEHFTNFLKKTTDKLFFPLSRLAIHECDMGGTAGAQ